MGGESDKVSRNQFFIRNQSIVRNQSLEAVSMMVRALIRESEYQNIFCEDTERPVTREWVELASWCLIYANYPAICRRILKKLDATLLRKTYVFGDERTIGDGILHSKLYTTMERLSRQEKAKYVNVSRWYDKIEAEDNLRTSEENEEIDDDEFSESDIL